MALRFTRRLLSSPAVKDFASYEALKTSGAPVMVGFYNSHFSLAGKMYQEQFAAMAQSNPKAKFYTVDVDDVLSEMDAATRQDKWTALLSEVHDEVIHVPLWGVRIPSVVNKQRLMGYTSGYQQFDYPMHKMTVVSGPKTVTVAPGAQTGLFSSVGRLDPHSYRPNEFFANNWVYEGLVAYGDRKSVV